MKKGNTFCILVHALSIKNNGMNLKILCFGQVTRKWPCYSLLRSPCSIRENSVKKDLTIQPVEHWIFGLIKEVLCSFMLWILCQIYSDNSLSRRCTAVWYKVTFCLYLGFKKKTTQKLLKVPWSTWCMLWWLKLANNAKYRDFICMDRSYFSLFILSRKPCSLQNIQI